LGASFQNNKEHWTHMDHPYLSHQFLATAKI